MSDDGNFSAVPPMVAALTDMPSATGALSIEAKGDGIQVERELEGGALEVVALPKPCLVAVQSGSNQVRYASLKGIMQAKKKPIDQKSFADLGVEPKRVNEYVKFELPPARSGETTFVESVAELVEKLHTDAKVI